MNETELDLCRELAGLIEHEFKLGDSGFHRGTGEIWQFHNIKDLESSVRYCYIHIPTIEQLLEILRERGLRLVVDIGDINLVTLTANEENFETYAGGTLKEALLRACIAVITEQTDEQ